MVDLYREGAVTKSDLQKALKKYDIDGGKPNPRLVISVGTRERHKTMTIEVKVP